MTRTIGEYIQPATSIDAPASFARHHDIGGEMEN
jgi:hypothetical protein